MKMKKSKRCCKWKSIGLGKQGHEWTRLGKKFWALKKESITWLLKHDGEELRKKSWATKK
jgi:hypothetical protein